jgi:hypothetical protein
MCDRGFYTFLRVSGHAVSRGYGSKEAWTGGVEGFWNAWLFRPDALSSMPVLERSEMRLP